MTAATKRVRDLEVSGRPVTLVWSRRRTRWEGCDSRFLEDCAAFDGALTARLARALVADAEVMTLRAAARRRGVGRHKINGLVRAVAGVAAERRRCERCRVLLVDETSIRRRHRLDALGRFCDLYHTGDLPEFHDIVNTLLAWSGQILARRRAGRPSNSRIEGTNNLLQVLRRTACGFTNTANFEARGLLIS